MSMSGIKSPLIWLLFGYRLVTEIREHIGDDIGVLDVTPPDFIQLGDFASLAD